MSTGRQVMSMMPGSDTRVSSNATRVRRCWRVVPDHMASNFNSAINNNPSLISEVINNDHMYAAESAFTVPLKNNQPINCEENEPMIYIDHDVGQPIKFEENEPMRFVRVSDCVSQPLRYEMSSEQPIRFVKIKQEKYDKVVEKSYNSLNTEVGRNIENDESDQPCLVPTQLKPLSEITNKLHDHISPSNAANMPRPLPGFVSTPRKFLNMANTPRKTLTPSSTMVSTPKMNLTPASVSMFDYNYSTPSKATCADTSATDVSYYVYQ